MIALHKVLEWDHKVFKLHQEAARGRTKAPTINSRTKIALIVTVITLFSGLTTALITFFTAKYGNDSN